jgi:aarF domain-containing kinase
MLRKISKYGIGGSLGLFAAYAAYNKGDFNSLSIVRFGRAGCTVRICFFYGRFLHFVFCYKASLVAFDYKWNLRNVDPDSPQYEPLLSEIHLRSAQRILDVCRKNGGCFIKVGQHIGGLDYLLPTEYVNTMKILHNQAPESDVNELFETIETDLKCKVRELFTIYLQVCHLLSCL